MLRVITIIISLFVSQISYATKPCSPPTEKWLIENVINKSSLVVYAEIKNYSQRSYKNPSKSREDYWTDIKIIKSLHGDSALSKLRIVAWQAHSYPTYVYKKGQRAIFFLSKSNDKYGLTDSSWMHCVPSIIDESDDQTFRLQYTNNRMSLDSISKKIKSLFTRPL